VIRTLRPSSAFLLAALLFVSACDSNTPTAPTPAPAPAPAPTPTPQPPPAPTPPPVPAAIESITLSESTVPSQGRPTATVKLTAPAPAGNAQIFLETTNVDLAKVPANISIAAGETTATFAIETSTVRTPTTVTIEARYLGVAVRTILTVVPPGVQPQFTVRSPSVGDDACAITSAAGAVDCVFDASRSTGFVSQYRWTLAVGGNELSFTMPEGTPAVTPTTTCALLAGGSISNGEVPMIVTLRVQDRDGNVSSPLQRTIDLVPGGQCGY
jgi:hypothetical protein